MASTYLTRSKSSPTSDKKGTISFWVKRSKITQEQSIIQSGSGSIDSNIYFNGSNDKLHVYDYQSGAFNFEYITTRVFRDTSAWYAITVEIDTSLTTASDRVKIYINGVRETVFDTATTPNQNITPLFFTSANPFYIGSYRGTGGYFDGLLSHFHYTDGYAYGASTFGSTDATTGEWKIKTNVTATYGTNGFFILKDGNTITDQSSNSNDFTLGGGQLTNLKDNPSNNFCNINTLYNQTTGQGVVVNNCGNTVYYASDSSRSAFGSIAPSSGKYYFEAKVFDKTRAVIGIVNMAWSNINGASGYGYHDDALNFGYDLDGQKTSGGSASAFGSALNNNDIVQVAMDLDNSKLYFGVNGVWQNSGDPTSGATGTGSAYNLASGANYTAACRLRNGTQIGFNFGNGQYSGSNLVTTNSGDGYSGADGASKFSYQPPTGYSAINTKGLNL